MGGPRRTAIYAARRLLDQLHAGLPRVFDLQITQRLDKTRFACCLGFAALDELLLDGSALRSFSLSFGQQIGPAEQRQRRFFDRVQVIAQLLCAVAQIVELGVRSRGSSSSARLAAFCS